MQTKTCIECGVTKPLEQFWIHNKSADGYSHRCGTCMRSRVGFGRTKVLDSEDGVKFCPKCKRALPKAMFDRNKYNAGGRQGYCKECWYQDKPGETERTCTICKETSPISNFHKCGSGHQSCCRACNVQQARAAKYAEKYGITVEEYDEMVAAQKGLCAICRKPEKRLANNRSGEFSRLCVDHVHLPDGTNGPIRELLCYNCNAALGLVGDDIDILKRMIAYISKHDPISVLFP